MKTTARLRGVALAAALVTPSVLRADTVRLLSVRAEPASVNANLVANSGFELGMVQSSPRGWRWSPRNTDAKLTLDSVAPHSGRRCLKLTNGTPFGADVYGTLELASPITLESGKPYTLSAWTKSEKPGYAWIGGGGDWNIRMTLPPTGGKWRRVWLTFTAGDNDRRFVLRVNTDSATPGVLVDDIKLEPGSEPTPVVPEGDAPAPFQVSSLAAVADIPGDGGFNLPFSLVAPRSVSALVEVGISGSTARIVDHLAIGSGAWRLQVAGSADEANDSPRIATLRVTANGVELARTETPLRFYSAANATRRLTALRARLPKLKATLARLRAMGKPVDYPLAAFTVLENFVQFAGEDVRCGAASDANRPFLKRGFMQIREMEQLAGELDQQLKAAANDRAASPAVPRWTGAVRPVVHRSSFVGPAFVYGRSKPQLRSLFFNGFGHFGQVVDDIEKFPRYGFNIIQIEVGPNSLFPHENVVDTAPIQRMASVLKRAGHAGVAVCLLISPHYLPDWMLQKYPEMRKKREGFLQYCLHAPEGQDLLRRFLATLLPPLKDYPALHSICLSNEPVNLEEPCEYATKEWHAWLHTRYGAVAALNAHWRASFADFNSIPLPNPFALSGITPAWLDYVRFNQEFFAGWHKMLADAVHAVAPNLPVHAKAMTWTMVNGADARYGVDAQLFGALSDINGNDSSDNWQDEEGDFAQSWQLNDMALDLQRSQKDVPVFNSENHLIDDNETEPLPPEHVRAVLWQAAVHGQSATTIWIWQRSLDPKNDVAGSLMYRPACAAAVGRVNLDLNRAADEMTAIQQTPPDLTILQSVTASVWDTGRYSDCLGKLYTALAFTGRKIGFITERQLEAGTIPNGPLFVPDIVHLSDPAFHTLRRHRGPLFLVGAPDDLSRDDADSPRAERIAGTSIPFRYGRSDWRSIWRALLPLVGKAAVEAREANGGPLWGVEWHSATTPGGTVVTLCNLRQKSVRVALSSHGIPFNATDILTGKRVRGPFVLRPLQIRLMRGALVNSKR